MVTLQDITDPSLVFERRTALPSKAGVGDASLAAAGLSRYLRVFDPGTFEPTESSDDEGMDRDRMMRSETREVLECEVGGYLVRAHRADAWGAILSLLLTLDAENHEHFHTLMRGCRRLSNSTPELDGLDALLLAPEQQLHDITLDRERRRERRGFATPADARAFLQMARLSPGTPERPASSEGALTAANLLARAYFRAADEDADAASAAPAKADAPRDARPFVSSEPLRDADGEAASIEGVMQLLAEAGVTPPRPRALLAAEDAGSPSAGPSLLGQLMADLLDHDEHAYLTRGRELAFLASALLAGCSIQSRPFTPQEAADAAAAICNLGLEAWPTRGPADASLPDILLVDQDLVTVFEVGWFILYRDVTLFVVNELLGALDGVRPGAPDTAGELGALRRRLARARDAGTPWHARGALDVLAGLDVAAWTGLQGLLDECPILPDALTAVLERSTTPVSPTAFAFISTMAQVGHVHAFMRALPGLLMI